MALELGETVRQVRGLSTTSAAYYNDGRKEQVATMLGLKRLSALHNNGQVSELRT